MNDIKKLYENIVPNNNDEDFINTIKSKTKLPHKKHTKNILIAVAMTMALTLSVGAVSGWDYTAIFNGFFKNNDKIISALKTPPEYEIIQNTFESLDFSLTGLFVDSGTLFLTIDITSDNDLFEDDETVFYKNDYRKGADFLILQDNKHINFGASYRTIFIDKKHITMLFEFYSAELTDFNGDELTFNMDGFCGVSHRENKTVEFFSMNGLAQFKFTVPENAENNQINIYPNITLDNSDITINEIYISPYLMKVNYVYPTIFNEDGSYDTDKKKIDIKLKSINGKTQDMTGSGWFGNKSTGVNNETTETLINIIFENVLDTNNIAAIIINDTEIEIE